MSSEQRLQASLPIVRLRVSTFLFQCTAYMFVEIFFSVFSLVGLVFILFSVLGLISRSIPPSRILLFFLVPRRSHWCDHVFLRGIFLELSLFSFSNSPLSPFSSLPGSLSSNKSGPRSSLQPRLRKEFFFGRSAAPGQCRRSDHCATLQPHSLDHQGSDSSCFVLSSLRVTRKLGRWPVLLRRAFAFTSCYPISEDD